MTCAWCRRDVPATETVRWGNGDTVCQKCHQQFERDFRAAHDAAEFGEEGG